MVLSTSCEKNRISSVRDVDDRKEMSKLASVQKKVNLRSGVAFYTSILRPFLYPLIDTVLGAVSGH